LFSPHPFSQRKESGSKNLGFCQKSKTNFASLWFCLESIIGFKKIEVLWFKSADLLFYISKKTLLLNIWQNFSKFKLGQKKEFNNFRLTVKNVKKKLLCHKKKIGFLIIACWGLYSLPDPLLPPPGRSRFYFALAKCKMWSASAGIRAATPGLGSGFGGLCPPNPDPKPWPFAPAWTKSRGGATRIAEQRGADGSASFCQGKIKPDPNPIQAEANKPLQKPLKSFFWNKKRVVKKLSFLNFKF
jgi:hypothetical protein